MRSDITDVTGVLVIGGGISGLALAFELAKRGLETTVLEANDFGAGATANSLRIVHGGLRYLQTLNFGRARRSIRARRELMQFAPGLIRPIECRIPLSKWGVRSKLPISAACMVNNVLGWGRNSGLAERDRLPASKFWGPAFLNSQEAGTHAIPAASWWDAVVMQPHRLMVRLVKSCEAQGVRVVNHARVTELILDEKESIVGARYQRIGEESIRSLRCRVVVDASGHGGRLFRNRVNALRPLCAWVGAANFLLNERSSNSWVTGLRARERDGLLGGAAKLAKWRDFFFVPTPAGLLVGTTYTTVNSDGGSGDAIELAFEQLLDEINRARPNRIVSESDIKHMFWGLLPATKEECGSASSRLLQRDIVVDGEKEFGLARYFRIQGIKLTTAFELATRVVPIVQRYFTKSEISAQDKQAATPTAISASSQAIFSETDPSIVTGLLSAMTQREFENFVKNCVQNEYALTLEDLLQRRLGLLPADYPGEAIRHALVDHMAILLGWPSVRRMKELSEADQLITATPARRVRASDNLSQASPK